MNNKAFFKLSYGLYVVSSSCDGKDSACIANTFVQVTSEPARVCITLNKNNYTTSVSYTHLRAHETGRNLVCRLLLEKKNTVFCLKKKKI